MRIGILTGGGDCPGLNAVIRAVVRKGVGKYGHEFVGFRDGWRGPLEGATMPLDVRAVRGAGSRAPPGRRAAWWRPRADPATRRGRRRTRARTCRRPCGRRRG